MRGGWKRTAGRFAAPVLGLALLGGVTAQQLTYTKPEDLAQYHQTVRRRIKAIPKQIGAWVGSEADIPRSARQLLSPNAILSRQYHNPNTGQSVSLMVVHCKDARDMGGHYPPICYPANGWTLQGTEDHTWSLPSGTVPVRAYRFTMDLASAEKQMYVLNVLALPDDALTRRMSRVRQAAADYRSHFYGAGQMQLLVDSRMKPAARRALFKRFYKAVQPAMAAIRSGTER